MKKREIALNIAYKFSDDEFDEGVKVTVRVWVMKLRLGTKLFLEPLPRKDEKSLIIKSIRLSNNKTPDLVGRGFTAVLDLKTEDDVTIEVGDLLYCEDCEPYIHGETPVFDE